ncbi:hypothetical protein AMECASPLE_011075 [Ameca splendens]|uniref:Uncharacterized protein n=1 Tax=Ameca splendens TaxID=208324 RepID=A0ABV0Y171_9TELE
MSGLRVKMHHMIVYSHSAVYKANQKSAWFYSSFHRHDVSIKTWSGVGFLADSCIMSGVFIPYRIKENLWPQIPNPGESTIGNWSPDYPLKVNSSRNDFL